MSVAVVPQSVRAPRKSGHKRCMKCGKVVSTRALACRRCGKRQRVNPTVIKLSLAGLFLAGLFIFAWVGPKLSYGRVADVAPPRPSLPHLAAPQGQHPLAVSAAELWAAYNHDPAGADQSYKGKPLLVSGTVAGVSRDFRGDVVVRLTTGDPFETARATLSSRDSAITAAIIKGQAVSLACTGRGALIGAPILDACLPR